MTEIITKTENTVETQNILKEMKDFDKEESEGLLDAKKQEIKEFVDFFKKVKNDSHYIPLLSEISKLKVSNLKVSTDAHGSLDAMLAPMLASGAFKKVRIRYVKIGDFLEDNEIKLLTQEEFRDLKKSKPEQQLEYFPILDLDFSDNKKVFVFNGDALDGGKFSINIFLTYLNLLRKQENLTKKKFYFNFGNHELFALFNMLTGLGSRTEGMLPGFAKNDIKKYSEVIKKHNDGDKLYGDDEELYKEYTKLQERRQFYFGLIGDIIRKNFYLFDFCKSFGINNKIVRISHSVILKDILEKISKNLTDENNKILEKDIKDKFSEHIVKISKCIKGNRVGYQELNKAIKSFISYMLNNNEIDNEKYSKYLCGLFMASKVDRNKDSSKFNINLKGVGKGEGYELTEKEKEKIYLIGHTIYNKESFEKVSNCIVPMDFGASSEYKTYEERDEPCPRLTVITNKGETIQIPLIVLGSKFTESKTCYLTCYVTYYLEDGRMVHKSLDIRKELFENPKEFMKEFKELFQNPKKFIEKQEELTKAIHTGYANLGEIEKFRSPTKIVKVSKVKKLKTQEENENKQPEKKCNETQKNIIKETNKDTKLIKENPYESPIQTQPTGKVSKCNISTDETKSIFTAQTITKEGPLYSLSKTCDKSSVKGENQTVEDKKEKTQGNSISF